MERKIGFMGLGLMGSGMAANLIKKGFDVTVWNRDPAKCAPLTEQGAKVAPSVAELAANCDVIVSMLRDDAVVLETIQETAMRAAATGTTFIDMSTVSPQVCEQLAATADALGLLYLDSPVMGSKAVAASGQLLALVGGSAELLEANRDIISAMCASIQHVGVNGSSAYLKLANNMFFGVVLAAMGESLDLAVKGGVPREQALTMLTGALTRVVSGKQESIAQRNWDTQFALELMHKDLHQAYQALTADDDTAPILAASREVYAHAIEQGKGKLDFAAISDRAK